MVGPETVREPIERMPRWFQDLLGRISLVGYSDHRERTREFRVGDLPKVLKIYKENFDGGSERTIEEYSSLFRHVLYVLEDASGIVGYCVCYVRLSFRGLRLRRIAAIYSIAIDAAHHGQGLGNMLLEDVIQDLRRNGIDLVRLYANVKNTPAVNLYLKHGFTIVGTKENICGTGKVCHIMDLPLR